MVSLEFKSNKTVLCATRRCGLHRHNNMGLLPFSVRGYCSMFTEQYSHTIFPSQKFPYTMADAALESEPLFRKRKGRFYLGSNVSLSFSEADSPLSAW